MASRPSSSASQASKFAELLVELGRLDAAVMPSSRATGANRIAAVGKARQAREEREAAKARAAQERDIERRREAGWRR